MRGRSPRKMGTRVGASGQSHSWIRTKNIRSVPRTALPLRLFPGDQAIVLVVKANEPGGKPPLDGATKSGTPAPAVHVAAALAVARVVDAMQNAPSHDPSLTLLWRMRVSPCVRLGGAVTRRPSCGGTQYCHPSVLRWDACCTWTPTSQRGAFPLRSDATRGVPARRLARSACSGFLHCGQARRSCCSW
jgi:hypothetical protein